MRSVFRLILVFIGILVTVQVRADELLVSAAASLTDAFNEVGKAYTGEHPATTVRFNFASSGALQQQILQGAPVDVFASASPKEMDALQRANRIDARSRVDFAANRLVLIAPMSGRVRHWNDLIQPVVKRIAIADPDSVPAGRYAKETLNNRGLWTAVQPKAVFGENVRQTLAYVSGGNVDAGIVFATDQMVEAKRVRIVDSAISGKDHEAIVYPAAVISGTNNVSAAGNFIRFLQGRKAQSILSRYGFQVAPKRPVTTFPGHAQSRPPHRYT